MSVFQKRQKLRQLQTKVVHMLFVLILTMLFSISEKAAAIAISTLPAGIYSPAFYFGEITGIDQRYTETGSLVRLTDYKAINFDAKTLAKFNAQASNLISTLNRFGAFNLGDSFNLGTLEIQTKPEIKYFAPVLAYGLTNSWTVGLALPVIHYTNDVKLSQSFSNISYYRSQFSGLSQDLDQALNTNIGEATQQALVGKGYSRLESRDKQFLADAQLVSLYKILEDSNQTVMHQLTFNLPTGPEYDTDDLLALNTFHKFSIENTFGYARQMGSIFKLVPYTSVKINIPDKISARVPKDEDDILPDQSTKETVQRYEGPTLEIGLQALADVFENLQVSLDYKIGAKAEDKYAGSGNSRYELLSKNTSSRWQKVSAEVVYSTVKSYLNKKAMLPMMISLSVFDTIAGTNTERKSGQELAMTLFF